MKKIIAILALITLISCEKEEIYNGELIISVTNKVAHNKYGQSPNGYYFEYLNNGVLIKDSGRYVGQTFKMNWNSNQRLYIKAKSKTDADMCIEIWKEGNNDINNPNWYIRNYLIAVIDE